MSVLVIDIQYFPTLDYYLTLSKYSNILFSEYNAHRKLSFRNRMVVPGANGPILLSVPLAGGRDQRTAYKYVEIDNMINWQRDHFRSIISAYNRSPFFEYFRDDLEALYSMKKYYLFEWNLACFEWLAKAAGLKPGFSAAGKDEIGSVLNAGDPGNRDLRDWFLPNNMAERRIYDLPYSQVFSDRIGFVPDTTVLDYLFCMGPQSLQNLVKTVEKTG